MITPCDNPVITLITLYIHSYDNRDITLLGRVILLCFNIDTMNWVGKPFGRLPVLTRLMNGIYVYERVCVSLSVCVSLFVIVYVYIWLLYGMYIL